MTVQNYGRVGDLQASAEAGAGNSVARAPVAAFADDTALFLDVDGTLLDIAETPGDVLTPAGLIGALQRIERKLCGALALVSGRPIEQLDRLFSPLRLRAGGVHGAEMRFDPEAEPKPTPYAHELPDSLIVALGDALRPFPGVFIERKTYSVAVHYRGAPDTGSQVREVLRRLIEEPAHSGIEIFDAHFAFELKLPGFDKGGAITMFLQTVPFVGRVPMFVGDDTTDEAGFAAVVARGGSAYSVGRWRPGASGVFEDPTSVRAWLAACAT